MSLAWTLTADRLHADERIARELTARAVAAVVPQPRTYVVEFLLDGEYRCDLVTSDEAEAVNRAAALIAELMPARIIVMQGWGS